MPYDVRPLENCTIYINQVSLETVGHPIEYSELHYSVNGIELSKEEFRKFLVVQFPGISEEEISKRMSFEKRDEQKEEKS